MRKFILIIMILILGQTGYGQSLFFNSLPNSIWILEANFTIDKLVNSHEISISKLNVSKGSINKNLTFWTFTDSTLKISNYDYLRKKDSLVETFKYSILPEPLLLELYLDKSVTLQFEVGITSSGYHAILLRTKDFYACFNIIADVKNATKDGVYMNEYIVEIPYKKVEKLNGKTVQISGKVKVISGISINESGVVMQGRNRNTNYIRKPKIRIIDN